MFSVLIMSAGSSSRMGGADKQLLPLQGKPVLQRSVEAFCGIPEVLEILIVTSEARRAEYAALLRKLGDSRVKVLGCGGDTRQQSVFAGIAHVSPAAEFVAVHDGARPLVPEEVIREVFAAAKEYGAAIPALPVKDTIKVADSGFIAHTPDRSTLYQAQTPQVFRLAEYQAAMEQALREGLDFTDDAQLFERTGRKVRLTAGSEENLKVTTPADIPAAEAILAGRAGEIANKFAKEAFGMRIGQGYDVHRLTENRKLIIGGVEIAYEKGLLGHSDADVLLHAVMDAILGALGLGDIGRHFPDTDPAYKGADSRVLLRHVAALAAREGYAVGNLDATIIAQAPKMKPHIPAIRENLAADLGIAPEQVNVKATTEEGLGFTGSGEGISASAVCLMIPRA